MKKIFYCLMTTFLVLFTSCEKEEDGINNLQNKEIGIDIFFERVISKNAKTNDDNVFYIDYEWNSKDKTIKITKVVEKELDFFLIEKKLSKEEIASKVYQVTCTKGGKDVWTKGCDGKFSCGSLIYDCLEAGGCAEICQQRMVYIPENNSFILID